MAEVSRYEPIGRVKAIYRYPVKSMRGEQIDSAPLRWVGFAGDRRFSFVQGGSTNRFPWLTAKIFPGLLTYTPYFCEPGKPNDSAVRVKTPAGKDFAVEAPELVEELSGLFQKPIFLLQVGRGTFDSAPVSLISTRTVQHIAEQTDLPAEVRRFRPNILIEAFEDKPFAEDGWIGSSLVFGSTDCDLAQTPRLRLDRPCERCVIVNHDPNTLASNPAVLKFLGQTHDVNAAVYASVEALGIVHEGDLIFQAKFSSLR